MRITNILNDPYLINFFQLKNLRKNTKNNYISSLKDYTNFIINHKLDEWKQNGISVNEEISFINLLSYLIDEAEYEEEKQIRMKHRKIKLYLVLYSNHIIQKKKPNTIRTRIANITAFYKKYEIQRPELDLNLPRDEKLITYDDLLSMDDIRQIVNHSNMKYKAITLLMISSGMGSAEVRNLTYQDFLNAIGIKEFAPITELEKQIKHIDCATWRIKRIKTDKEYVTFSSPESVYAIIDYLKLKNKGRYPVNNIDYIIFNHRGGPMSQNAIPLYYSEINEKLGFGKLNDRNKLHAHGLREWMATMTGKRGAPESTTGKLLGHKVKTMTGHYVKMDITALKNEYLRLLPYLSIEKVETRTVESREYRELKEKYENDSQKKSAEIENLTEKLEKLEERQDLIDKLQDNPEYLDKVSKMKKTS